MTSRTNKSRNSCQLVARAAVKISALHSVCCQLKRIGNELGLFNLAPPGGTPLSFSLSFLTTNPAAGEEMEKVVLFDTASGGGQANGSLTCMERSRSGRVKPGSRARRSSPGSSHT